MPISFEPGEELQASVPSKMKFFAPSLSWRDQKKFSKRIETEVKALETDEEQTEAAIGLICERLTRTEPPIEINPENIENALDFEHIWTLLTALKFNLTPDEKKT